MINPGLNAPDCRGGDAALGQRDSATMRLKAPRSENTRSVYGVVQ